MTALSPSNYEKISLSGQDIRPKVISFEYYESLFSPIVTANLAMIDTEGISSNLQLSGEESVSFSIRSKLGTIDFDRNPLYLNTAPVAAKDANREAVLISLMSRYAIENEKSTISRTYSGKISDSVRKILTQDLKVPPNRVNIDITNNVSYFSGASEDAFKVILKLCPKSIGDKTDGAPGYFLYETQRGMHFKSISKLIEQDPYPYTYTYNSISRFDEDGNDFKILSYKQIRSQTVLNGLRSGLYSSRNIFFNPRELTTKELVLKLNRNGDIQYGNKNLKLKYLGKKPSFSEEILSDDWTRTHFHVLDVGMFQDKSTKTNNSAEEWQPLATTRYNIMFNKVARINIPCNPNLTAGDIINIQIQKTSDDTRKTYDETESGKYLILNVCHSFNRDKSYTSLTITKDTFG